MKKITKFIAAAASVAVCAASFGIFGRQAAVSAAEEDDPAALIQNYAERVVNGEFDDVYNESFSVQLHLNPQDKYVEALKEIYGDISELQYKKKTEDAETKTYALYDQGVHISDLMMRKQADGTWACATVFPEQKDYIIEVPAGLTVTANGTELGEHYRIEASVPASNYKGMSDTSTAPLVDRYRVATLLDIPNISSASGELTVMKDVTGNTLYVGVDSTDNKELKDLIIQYAVTCAKFPAKEGGVGNVASISVTNSEWYSRVSGVQNNWFTNHSTSRFSNEDVLKIVRQGENGVIANVVFDYYATNGDVERTWYCGYQMTLINQNGLWKIAGMGIDSTMNPNSDKIK